MSDAVSCGRIVEELLPDRKVHMGKRRMMDNNTGEEAPHLCQPMAHSVSELQDRNRASPLGAKTRTLDVQEASLISPASVTVSPRKVASTCQGNQIRGQGVLTQCQHSQRAIRKQHPCEDDCQTCPFKRAECTPSSRHHPPAVCSHRHR